MAGTLVFVSQVAAPTRRSPVAAMTPVAHKPPVQRTFTAKRLTRIHIDRPCRSEAGGLG